MSSVGFKKMNWFPRESAWNLAIQQRVKRAEMMAEFRARNQTLSAAFQTAFTNQIAGVGEVAAKSAYARLEKDVQKRMAEVTERLNKIA